MTPQTAHLSIVNPLAGGQRFAKLFSTHPPMEDRIAALRSLAPSRDMTPSSKVLRRVA